MKKISSVVMAAVIGVAAVAASVSGASAQNFSNGWGPNNCGPRGCGPGWHGGGPGWHGGPPRGYGPGPRYYHGGGYYYGNPGVGIAAGALLGLGVGAAIASSNQGGYEVAPPQGVAWRNHVDYCEDQYRSYDPRTDTFLGYDGQAYRCVGSY
jgi:hypothetical protein